MAGSQLETRNSEPGTRNRNDDHRPPALHGRRAAVLDRTRAVAQSFGERRPQGDAVRRGAPVSLPLRAHGRGTGQAQHILFGARDAPLLGKPRGPRLWGNQRNPRPPASVLAMALVLADAASN